LLSIVVAMFLQHSTLIHSNNNGQTVLFIVLLAYQYPAVDKYAFISLHVSADVNEVLEDVNNV